MRVRALFTSLMLVGRHRKEIEVRVVAAHEVDPTHILASLALAAIRVAAVLVAGALVAFANLAGPNVQAGLAVHAGADRDLVLRVGAAAESVRPVAVHAVREHDHALDFLGVVLIAVLVALHREGKAAARGNLDGSAVDAGFIVQIVHLILEFGCQFRVETVVGGGKGEVLNGGQLGVLFCGCHSMCPPIYSSSSASASAGSASSKPSFSAAACSSGVGVSSLRSAS